MLFKTFKDPAARERGMKNPDDPNMLSCNVDDPVLEVARRMREEEAGRAVVLRSGQVAGLITERQIQVRAAAPGSRLEELKVGDIMTFKDLAPGAPGLQGAAREDEVPRAGQDDRAPPSPPMGP